MKMKNLNESEENDWKSRKIMKMKKNNENEEKWMKMRKNEWKLRKINENN